MKWAASPWGTEYEIDLGKQNAKALEAALRPYLEAGTRVGLKRSSSKSGGEDLADIRSWGREQGWTVSDRGGVPGELIAAFDSAP